MTQIEGFLRCHWNVTVFDDIWAGIPTYPNVYHCGKACWHISQSSGKERQNFGRIIYMGFAAALHDTLPRHCEVSQ